MSDGAKESVETMAKLVRHHIAQNRFDILDDGSVIIDAAGLELTLSEALANLDLAAPAQSNGNEGELARENAILKDMLFNPNPDDEPDNLRLHREKCEALDQVYVLRSQLATAQATYLQFCKKHDEKNEKLRDALKFIADGYDNQDVNHVDFRVKAYQAAIDALKDVQS